MQGKYRKLLNPFKVASAIRHRFWFWLARRLQFYLVRTHFVWGDDSRVSIGRDVELADTILNCRSGRIIIEDEVFFGHHVLLLAGKHDFRHTGIERKMTVPDSGDDIIIRQGAWIASSVIVIGPCEIGEHSVVVAGSVVRGDVAPRMIYGGNPARPIMHIDFDSLTDRWGSRHNEHPTAA